ncbi:MAG: hypothetical protein ABI611_13515 [Solirubrobacteraceae bacterium]
MNYAGCSACGSIVPLMCAGSFPMHPPMPVQASPMGPYCGFCGLLQPVFVCTTCGTMQGVYLPGMAVPQAQRMGMPLVAPVLQAPSGAPPNQVRAGLKDVALDFLSSAAKQAGTNVGNQMTAWA